jgi:DNA-binding transcriptional regulator WhiA
MSRAYLLGALHDATEREYTYRLSQKDSQYVETIASIVGDLGFDAWTYQEGKSRDIYVAEFAKTVLNGFEITSTEEKRAYARGYFDADGSVPTDPSARFYVYFAQNDRADLRELKTYLAELDIETGTLHQPSADNAPEYWRFYVSTSSHERFAKEVGSSHPRKRQMLREMRRSMP